MDKQVAKVEDGPLFGLHNRDYPTLWAACRLADWTAHELIALDKFIERVVEEAWEFGRLLSELDHSGGRKLSALFPKNAEKRKSSENAFRYFALGDCRVLKGAVRANGPLFQWRLCQVAQDNGRLVIGLTPEGYELLSGLCGMTASVPHPAEMAGRFLSHIRLSSQADWRGFAVTLAGGADELSRQELVGRFQSEWPSLSEAEVSTNAAGYVSRAREWGLLSLKQDKGRYSLTEFGHSVCPEMTRSSS